MQKQEIQIASLKCSGTLYANLHQLECELSNIFHMISMCCLQFCELKVTNAEEGHKRKLIDGYLREP